MFRRGPQHRIGAYHGLPLLHHRRIPAHNAPIHTLIHPQHIPQTVETTRRPSRFQVDFLVVKSFHGAQNLRPDPRGRDPAGPHDRHLDAVRPHGLVVPRPRHVVDGRFDGVVRDPAGDGRVAAVGTDVDHAAAGVAFQEGEEGAGRGDVGEEVEVEHTLGGGSIGAVVCYLEGRGTTYQDVFA